SKRDVHGVLLLDKPQGITSNDVLQKVKRIFNAKKAGHTGSLDKPATGLLPLCFGEATKFTTYLLNADKHYISKCKLGVITSTGDQAGEVIAESEVPGLSSQTLQAVLEDFRGEIQQVPPMYSAIKQNGQRLYKLAYQGKEVERPPRAISIYDIELLSFQDDEFEIKVHCSKGTYIRTLVEDIGNRIGCGAHITQLIRTGVSKFTSDEMVSMQTILDCAEQGNEALDELLLPIDSIIGDMPEVTLNGSITRYIENGQPVMVPQAPTEGLIRIYNEKHDFIGIGEVLDDGRVAPKRLVNLPPA
ncbi:MAG: tRNA pseudouridine(55) synthase TruB, partial [Gammaproteobacteria bacterium]|nr:tRNA pseudouridine(55) synthase TruB [Gammaproteobacteria bacterium]